jgi:hypothetical protein
MCNRLRYNTPGGAESSEGGLFLPAAVTKKLKNNKQHNIRWGEHDIATTNIDVIVTRN